MFWLFIPLTSLGCNPIRMPRRPCIHIAPVVSIHVPPTLSIHIPAPLSASTTSPPETVVVVGGGVTGVGGDAVVVEPG
jgi:hypothetical protein